MNKYVLLKEQYLPDLKINAKYLQHKKSGARVVLFPSDDANKVYAITFKTAPLDDTGVTHILEHSVLCGSKKYPLKEPFVELVKGSVNTFLNAFTYADKTMYPVASVNDKDFKNLMSVYTDAVFYPAIYDKKEIFLQEGWRYELNSIEDDITYNGVVYNEMKGAFSSAEDVLANKISLSLYPDNCYGYVSGGDPDAIPDLSYEEFLDYHKRFYHPSNSYIFLYGDMDFEERLDWLDENYLSHFERQDPMSNIALQKPFKTPVTVESYYPISDDDTDDGKYYYSYNVSYGNNLNIKECLAIDFLVNVLFNTTGAYVKEALINSGLGADAYASYRQDYLEPMINIVLNGANKGLENQFKEVIEQSLKEVVENGVDKEALLAAIDFDEFKVREAKYTIPKGLIYCMNIFNSWLYDDNEPFMYVDILKYYDELRSLTKTSFYEDLINKCFLNNNHKSFVNLIPSKGFKSLEQKRIAKKLADYKNSLSDEELNMLIKQTENLRIYQSTPDSKEAIETIPRLEITDIKREPMNYNLKEHIIDGVTCYQSDYNTNGIMYVKYYFDVTKCSNEELQYLKLLANVLGYMSTDKYSYSDISVMLKRISGGASFRIEPMLKRDKSIVTYFVIRFSCLEKNLAAINELIINILYKTMLTDKKRFKDILSEYRLALESEMLDAGHVYASTRAAASCTEGGLLDEILTGISFYEFIMKIINNLDKDFNDYVNTFKDPLDRMLAKDNLVIALTGDDILLDALRKDNIIKAFKDKNSLDKHFTFEMLIDNVAYKAPIDVNYVALATTIDPSIIDGSYNVIRNAISNSYLWQSVRVQGGAYGCFMTFVKDGRIIFSSYRDSNIEKTIESYKHTVDFLDSFKPNQRDFDLIKIGAIGPSADAEHVEITGNRALFLKLAGFSYEDRVKERASLLDTTLDDFKKFKEELVKAFKNSHIVVIGNEGMIDREKDKFNKVLKLKQ